MLAIAALTQLEDWVRIQPARTLNGKPARKAAWSGRLARELETLFTFIRAREPDLGQQLATERVRRCTNTRRFTPVIEWRGRALGGAAYSDLTRSVPVRKGVHIECKASNGRRDILGSDDSR
jgi:hypothetical protein